MKNWVNSSIEYFSIKFHILVFLGSFFILYRGQLLVDFSSINFFSYFNASSSLLFVQYESFIQCFRFKYLNLYRLKIFQFCHIRLFLYIIGALGSSNFINIAVIIIIGLKIISHIIDQSISINLFITLHQLSREVFFISITGILLINETSELFCVISKELMIVLYLIHSILE
ncbi:MAG: hypothetical protein U9Q66_02870 [Patescibacteria group bacterium]|nr:hypothetical protein [Patescibacteria group bacterium]